LDKWVAAKRAKDFATADRLREELRKMGVEPDCARRNVPSSMSGGGGGGGGGYDRGAPRGWDYPPSHGYDYPPPHHAPPPPYGAHYGAPAPYGGYARGPPPPQYGAHYGAPAPYYDPYAQPPPAAHQAYPPQYPPPRGGGGHLDPHTERQLDQWVAAKRAKDFGTADRLRDELRKMGVEPDDARPSGGYGGGGGGPAKRTRMY
jgi:hypothetical protein